MIPPGWSDTAITTTQQITSAIRSLPKARPTCRLLRASVHTISALPRAVVRTSRNLVRRLLCRSDYERWRGTQGLEVWWDARTEEIARFVPAGLRVIEFGAGRRQLERFLPADCTYTPSDLVGRGAGTIVCDLNHRPLPDLSHVAPDVAVFGGVLEYIRDVQSLIQWLADAGTKICVASFDPVPAGLGIVGRYRESIRRAYYGYMNSLTEEQLLHTFEVAGFACIQRQPWTAQVILQLVRRR